MTVEIKIATASDLARITEIYNEAVLNTVGTFDLTPKTIEFQREKWVRRGPRHPLLAAHIEESCVGYASLNPWSERAAYDGTAEVSLYVDRLWQARGIGKALLKALIEQAHALNYHTLIARIASENKNSLHLHHAFGFEVVGQLREVGFKFNRYLDVHLMQKFIL